MAGIPGSRPYQVLITPEDNELPTLIDTFRSMHPQLQANVGTFNGFRGTERGARIDWILTTDDFKVIDAAIDRTSRNGRYPSDHFPVTAVVKLKD